jgi:4-hydroxy 2-oxovalerate aldolase
MSKEFTFDQLSKPVLLDVTLRDGGYLNDWDFGWQHIRTAVTAAHSMGADIIEVGYLDNHPGLPLAASCPPRFLEQVDQLKGDSMIAGMMRPGVENPQDVLRERKSWIDLVRIPVDLRNVAPANRLSAVCEEYEVPFSFNLTSVSCYSLETIESVVTSLNKESSMIYIADSRGALYPEDVRSIVCAIKKQWGGAVGYHAHNNLGLAKENTEAALHSGCSLLDGSVAGIGLGGRNLNLRTAVDIAKNYRADLSGFHAGLDVSEKSLGVAEPGDEMDVYRLSGEKNIKMEWVQLMIEQLGISRTTDILGKVPRCSLFHHNELKPYIEKKYWDLIQW